MVACPGLARGGLYANEESSHRQEDSFPISAHVYRALDPCGLLRLGQRSLDQLAELRVRLRAVEEVAVDEERRGALNPGVLADLGIGVDLGLMALRVQRRLPFGHVEAELLRVTVEGRSEE